MTEQLEIEPMDSLEEARAAWEQLEGEAANPFGTWAWADAWWQRFGRGRLHLHVVRERGRLAAVLPLYAVRRGPITVARFLGHGPADQLGPVCGPADRALAARALAEVVHALPRRGLLLAERLAAPEGMATLLGGRAVRAESSPLAALDEPTWDAWLARRSSNLRSQVRRRERKLVREHDLAFRLSDDPERVAADLEVLFALHEARWQGHSGAFAPALRDFHRDFAQRALERGWLRLWLAEAAGSPVAAWYGFRFEGAEWYYQAGRDPSWDEQGVGVALLVHTMRDALETGAHVYRFGLGDEPYKARFASGDPGLLTVVAGGGIAPSVAAGGAALARRLPHRARRVVVHRAA